MKTNRTSIRKFYHYSILKEDGTVKQNFFFFLVHILCKICGTDEEGGLPNSNCVQNKYQWDNKRNKGNSRLTKTSLPSTNIITVNSTTCVRATS